MGIQARAGQARCSLEAVRQVVWASPLPPDRTRKQDREPGCTEGGVPGLISTGALSLLKACLCTDVLCQACLPRLSS